MKNLFKFLLSLILIMSAGYLFLCISMKNNPGEMGQAVNKFNILAKEEPRYVKIDNTHARDEDGYGNYKYNLKSYNEQGIEQPIEFTGMGKLKQGHYLKLTTKGTYVITYEEAFENSIPKEAYDRLN